MHWRMLETKAERKARIAREEAFWNRPDEEDMADLVAKDPRVKTQPSITKASNVISLVHWRKRRGSSSGEQIKT